MVSLRALELADFEGVREWMECPALAEYFRRYPPARMFLQRDSFLQALAGTFMVCEDGRPVGLVNIANLDQHAKKAEFGIMIAPQPGPRGGVAVEALKQFFDYGFSYLGLNRMYCLVLEGRPEIEALCQRWQVLYEGTLKQNIFFDGRFHDEKIFSMTADRYYKIEDR